MSTADQRPDLDIGLRIVARFENGDGLDYRLQDLTRPNGPALRFIDSVGDTFFNELQVKALIEELRDVRTRAKDPDLIKHIDGLIAFAERDMPPHHFLWFIGD